MRSIENLRWARRLVLLAPALLLAPAISAAAQEVAAPFAGSTTCQICHPDISKAFARNLHQAVEKKKGWEARACESCHGAALKHAETADAAEIRNPAKLSAAAVDKVCLTCHLNQSTHVGRLESSHAKDQVGCTTCHSVHGSNGHGTVARAPADVNKQCSGCHVAAWAQFQKAFRHRVPENAMSCVDCHNPHGTTRPAMTTAFASNEPGCLNCHGDKRGPFVFEHQPVRFEGCGACHEPHGSTNPRMLTRPIVRQTCLECHSSLPSISTGVSGVTPPSFHDLRSPRYQNCTVCHQKIHGSHVDRNLLR